MNVRSPLDLVEEFITRHVWLPKQEQIVALCLWVVHTHAIEHAYTTPYLSIESPVPRCGKSLLLEVMGSLAASPVSASNITAAALFRTIDADQPTMLVDEMDAQNGEDRERRAALQSILNAGYRRGAQATVIRCEPRTLEPRRFDVFGAKAFAGIGSDRILHESTLDRTIRIRMQRKPRGVEVERFRPQFVEEEAAGIRTEIATWVTQHDDALENATPSLPSVLHDRARESWEPLIAIADLMGGDWPERARIAAVELSGTPDEEDEHIAIVLLGDIREIFDAQADQRLPVASRDICTALCRRDDRPWRRWVARRSEQGFDPIDLASRLKPFGIRSRSIRRGQTTGKGYRREQFEEAWALYLDDDKGSR